VQPPPWQPSQPDFLQERRTDTYKSRSDSDSPTRGYPKVRSRLNGFGIEYVPRTGGCVIDPGGRGSWSIQQSRRCPPARHGPWSMVGIDTVKINNNNNNNTRSSRTAGVAQCPVQSSTRLENCLTSLACLLVTSSVCPGGNVIGSHRNGDPNKQSINDHRVGSHRNGVPNFIGIGIDSSCLSVAWPLLYS
jgi:hypothetical protein